MPFRVSQYFDMKAIRTKNNSSHFKMVELYFCNHFRNYWKFCCNFKCQYLRQQRPMHVPRGEK